MVAVHELDYYDPPLIHTFTHSFIHSTYGVAIAQLVQLRAGGWTDGFRFPADARYFSLLYSIQTYTEVHPAFYQMDSEAFPRGKAAKA
jgi:hypothetical protein